VNGTETDTGKDGDQRLGDHGKVDGNSVALADAHLLQGPGGLGHVAEELAVSDIAALVRLVGLVDDGDSVGVLEGVAVNAVVRGVELTLKEPRDVAVGKGAAAYSLEVAGPGKELACALSPEGVGLCDGLLVKLLVLFETCNWTSA
jgi:hypothetical protein